MELRSVVRADGAGISLVLVVGQEEKDKKATKITPRV
jgi:hypothetical protein